MTSSSRRSFYRQAVLYFPSLGRPIYIRVWKFHQLLAVGRWFPPGAPVSSTRKLISSSFHRLDMTLAVAEALNPNKPNQTPSLNVGVSNVYT